MANIITKNGSRIHINGTLSQINGKWYVDGKEVNLNDLCQEADDGKVVNITINVEGEAIERLEVESCKTITINGDCKRIHTQMGDVTVKGNVDGDVHTNLGAIECGNVGGDAHTNMGSVNYKKIDNDSDLYKKKYLDLVRQYDQLKSRVDELKKQVIRL